MREHNVRSSSRTAFARMLAAAAVGVLLGAALTAVPSAGSPEPLLGQPALAWAAGADDTADTADALGAEGGQANGAASNSQDGTSSAGGTTEGPTKQTAGTAQGASSSASAQSSASSQSSSAASGSSAGEAAVDRGYVGPWYALNHSYVVAVEDRFDAITDDEYATTLTRTVLIAVAAAAALLAIVAFVRAHRVQARASRRRR